MEWLIELLDAVGSTTGDVVLFVITLLVALTGLVGGYFYIIRRAFEAASAVLKFLRELQKPA